MLLWPDIQNSDNKDILEVPQLLNRDDHETKQQNIYIGYNSRYFRTNLG